MRVQVARIGKPHGIRGEVTVQVMTDVPEDRFVPGSEFTVEGAARRTLTVAGARWNKDILLLAFEEVPDRNDAETLRGAELFIETDDVEAGGEGGDAWYEHELEGLDARVGGASVGRVVGLRTGAAQDLLIVEGTDGAEILVPFVAEIVPEVDVEGGFVVLTPPPGLLEVNREDAEEAGPAGAAAPDGK